MIVAAGLALEPGDTYRFGHPMKECGEVAVCRIVREVTKVDFLDYWRTTDPVALQAKIERVGPVEAGHYYEVLTD